MANISGPVPSANDSYLGRKAVDYSPANLESKPRDSSQRIEEIKRKYDTYGRRDRSYTYGAGTKARQINKENAYAIKQSLVSNSDKYGGTSQVMPSFGSNQLKQSTAMNRLDTSVLLTDADCNKNVSFNKNECSKLSMLDDRIRKMSLKKSTFEDEALLSKVREMKESLNQEMQTSGMNGRSKASQLKYKQGNFRPEPSFDPRVENIDKINSKIKEILSCLSENEKQSAKYTQECQQESRQSHNSQNLRQDLDIRGSNIGSETGQRSSNFGTASIITEYSQGKSPIRNQEKRQHSNYNFSKNREERIPVSNYPGNEPSMRPSLTNHHKSYDCHLTSGEPKGPEPQRVQQSSLFRQKEEYVRTPTCMQRKNADNKSTLKQSRSYSQIDTIGRSTLKERSVLKSGKQINEEISRIQNRIEEMEKQKKKLNIQFTPFSVKNRSASVLPSAHTRSADQNYSKVLPRPSAHMRSSTTEAKQAELSPHFNQIRQQDMGLSRPTILTEQSRDRSIGQKHCEDQRNSFDLNGIEVKAIQPDRKEHKCEDNSDEYESRGEMGQSVNFGYEAVKKRTDDGIQERRKRLQDYDVIKTDSLKKLVNVFCHQAKHDQTLRNLKIWFEQESNRDKFRLLAEKLTKDGARMDDKECRTVFKVEESENNPFFSAQSFDGSIESLAKAYMDADRHWTSCVRGKFDRESLMAEGFTKNKLDLQRKGYIQLQDLVRLLNIESGTFYRNRDIFLIFRRLTKTNRTSFEEIINELAA